LIFVIDYGLLFWAERRVASGLAALMMASIPSSRLWQKSRSFGRNGSHFACRWRSQAGFAESRCFSAARSALVALLLMRVAPLL
jgi:hypothetical protein